MWSAPENTARIEPIMHTFIVDVERQWKDGSTTKDTVEVQAFQVSMVDLLILYRANRPEGLLDERIVSIIDKTA